MLTARTGIRRNQSSAWKPRRRPPPHVAEQAEEHQRGRVGALGVLDEPAGRIERAGQHLLEHVSRILQQGLRRRQAQEGRHGAPAREGVRPVEKIKPGRIEPFSRSRLVIERQNDERRRRAQQQRAGATPTAAVQPPGAQRETQPIRLSRQARTGGQAQQQAGTGQPPERGAPRLGRLPKTGEGGNDEGREQGVGQRLCLPVEPEGAGPIKAGAQQARPLPLDLPAQAVDQKPGRQHQREAVGQRDPIDDAEEAIAQTDDDQRQRPVEEERRRHRHARRKIRQLGRQQGPGHQAAA